MHTALRSASAPPPELPTAEAAKGDFAPVVALLGKALDNDPALRKELAMKMQEFLEAHPKGLDDPAAGRQLLRAVWARAVK